MAPLGKTFHISKRKPVLALINRIYLKWGKKAQERDVQVSGIAHTAIINMIKPGKRH